MKLTKKIIASAVIGTLSAGLVAEPLLAAESQVTISKANKTSSLQKKAATPADSSVEQTEARQGKYQSLQTKENISEQFKLQQQKVESKKRSGKRVEVLNKQKSALDHVYLYDASVYLLTDEDGDGYFSQIKVNFDADASINEYYDLYAELYIREQGSSDWTHYFTTDVFEIYGSTSSDDYHVTTRFNTGFPPEQYEIAIDLFEYGYSGVVDSLDGNSDGDLSFLPIEDTSYEVINGQTGITVSTVKTEIFTDADNDGFYRDFKISFDVDSQVGQRELVAKLYQKSSAGSWQFEAQTDTFTVDGNSTDDTMAIEGEWQSGYATNYYDFKIEIVDSFSDEVLAEAGHEFSSLLEVPLEDAAKDTKASTGSNIPTPPPSTSSSESGGGSWSLWGLALIGAFAWLRRK